MAHNTPITLAAITGAHGVTGEVRLKLFGEGLEGLSAHKSFNGGALNLTKLKSDNKGGAIARFAEVSSREGAEGLRGTALSVPRDALPPLQDGEYYHVDLIGLTAVTDKGAEVGKLINVLNFGAGDLLEIEMEGGKTFLVPMKEEAVLEWDEKTLTISEDYAEP